MLLSNAFVIYGESANKFRVAYAAEQGVQLTNISSQPGHPIPREIFARLFSMDVPLLHKINYICIKIKSITFLQDFRGSFA